jgi:hypothetical protein
MVKINPVTNNSQKVFYVSKRFAHCYHLVNLIFKVSNFHNTLTKESNGDRQIKQILWKNKMTYRFFWQMTGCSILGCSHCRGRCESRGRLVVVMVRVVRMVEVGQHHVAVRRGPD